MFASSTSPSTALVSAYCLTFAFLSSLLLTPTNAATEDEWRSRSIYQIITDRFARPDNSTSYACNVTAELYCGGTFGGIMNQLDYIQGMGFTAIWISPVVQNINQTTAYGQGYHGFWTQDITKINEHFGGADELKALSTELHRRDMYLMIDVVVNDMAYAGKGADTDYSTLVPFNKEEYFHPFCLITNYGNQTDAQDCWLGDDTVALPDLKTELPFVQDTWNTWITEMVANYSLDGLRIDAAKHVDKPFWPGFQKAAGVFTLGEVFDADATSACSWAVNALNSVLNYPNWYYIVSILGNSSNAMGGLEYEFGIVAQDCYDSTLLGTFSENHDVARFASVSDDLSRQKNALAFNFMSDGIPTVYYGAEQRFNGGNDPNNREALWLNAKGYDTTSPLYLEVKALNAARSAVGNYMKTTNYSGWSPYWAYKAQSIYVTDDVVVFRKGYVNSIVTALTNVGVGAANVGPYNVSDTNFSEGIEIIEVLNCTKQTAGYGGSFNITLINGEPQVWIPGALLVNTTDICTDLVKKVTDRIGNSGSVTSSSTPRPSLHLASLLLSVIMCTTIALISS
ncbi:glycoside hydrolase family 13 protein [Coleophoma cylindrospora]|uniref:alpha-amylase n=1 Tax=Coleophoma cylindrospora TaxID=1849047 RepID=A0A3D8S9S4_9HELO|nr:glycoside hydrolase family 13 protein [Coleophoma cylindrospora]